MRSIVRRILINFFRILYKFADYTIYENTSDDNRHRFFRNVGLSYYFTKKLYVTGKAYGDTYSQTISSRVAIGSAALPKYDIQKRNNSEFNYEGRLHYNNNFGDLQNTVNNSNDNYTNVQMKNMINEQYVNVFFDFDETRITPGSISAINFLIKYLNANPNASVDVIGYADELGDFNYNIKKAAAAIKDDRNSSPIYQDIYLDATNHINKL